MARYIVRREIRGRPTGQALGGGRLKRLENATRYYHPSGARAALNAYRAKHARPSVRDLLVIFDERERQRCGAG